jgi:hypothetical protein
MFVPGAIRGEGQFDPWNSANYLFLLGSGGLTLLSMTAGILKISDRRVRLWLVPILASAAYGTTGSRGVILPFIFFFLPSVIHTFGKLNKKAILLGIAGLASATLIPQLRPGSYGIWNFIQGIPSGFRDADEISALRGISSLENTMITFAIAEEAKPPGVVWDSWRLVVPLPSFIVHPDVRLTNIMPYLGSSEENSGAPFPALGELYFFFGWFGVLLGIPAGLLGSWLFFRCRLSLNRGQGDPLFWCLLYMTFLFGVIMSMHSGLRTLTRYPIWALGWYYIYTRLCLPVTKAVVSGATSKPIGSSISEIS